MIEVEVTWKVALRIFWSFLWRVLVFSILVGSALGFIIGLVYGLAYGVMPPQIILGLIGYGVGLGVTAFIFKRTLNARFKKYRVAVVEA